MSIDTAECQRCSDTLPLTDLYEDDSDSFYCYPCLNEMPHLSQQLRRAVNRILGHTNES